MTTYFEDVAVGHTGIRAKFSCFYGKEAAVGCGRSGVAPGSLALTLPDTGRDVGVIFNVSLRAVDTERDIELTERNRQPIGSGHALGRPSGHVNRQGAVGIILQPRRVTGYGAKRARKCRCPPAPRSDAWASIDVVAAITIKLPYSHCMLDRWQGTVG